MKHEEHVIQLLDKLEEDAKNYYATHGSINVNVVKDLLVEAFNSLQFRLVPANVENVMSSSADLQRIIIQNTSKDIQEEDISGEQLIKQLFYEGWLILPPNI